MDIICKCGHMASEHHTFRCEYRYESGRLCQCLLEQGDIITLDTVNNALAAVTAERDYLAGILREVLDANTAIRSGMNDVPKGYGIFEIGSPLEYAIIAALAKAGAK
jgi:hypothetical protein